MKNIVIINSSLRRDGNSELLAKQFEKGATEAGNKVTVINLRDMQLKYCLGCMACLKIGRCVQSDGVNDVLGTVGGADVVVLATPIYYYSVCGQLKTFLDRMNPLYGRDNKFKDFYLLATSADAERSAMDGAIHTVQGFLDCFEGATLSGVVYGVGADEKGSVKGTPAFVEAYEMAKKIS